MQAPQFAKGTTGSAGGVFATSGSATLNLFVTHFELSSTRRQHPFPGYGDGGENSSYDGSHSWSAAVRGKSLSGKQQQFNPALYSGTETFHGTAYLKTDAGVTFSGDVKVAGTTIGTALDGNGESLIVFTVVGQGPLSRV